MQQSQKKKKKKKKSEKEEKEAMWILLELSDVYQNCKQVPIIVGRITSDTR